MANKEYNNKTVLECFNIIFPVGCGIPDYNLPPKVIGDIPCQSKISRYTSDPPTATISIASKNILVLLPFPVTPQ